MKKLRKTQANKLDEFIEDHLLPHKEFQRQVNEAIDIICTFLKETCFQEAAYPFRVSKVVKGGSSGKGTTLKDLSDADLVVFLTNLTSFQENFKHRARFINEIRRQLEACQREKIFEVEFEVQKRRKRKRRKRKLRALSFVLRSPGFCQGVKFDVLPAFDALAKYSQSQGPRKQEVDGSGLKDSVWAVEDPGRTVPAPLLRPDQVTEDYKPDPQIYIQLIQECENLGKEGEFSPCFTELQRDFLKNRPAKLKSLIRLVKHWYQLCKKRHGKKLPSQYALELLTIYAWEQEGSKTKFKTAEGFRTVLELVLKHQDLCIYWKKYYDFENPVIRQCLKRQLEKPRPVILDPADPTGNVAGREPQRWQLLAQEVTVWLRYSCCKNWNGSPVSTWNVPVTPPHYLCDLILLMTC